MQDRLKNVQQIQCCVAAFAAILVDGSVVTWGRAICGGDSRAVQGQLKKVQQIQASESAFAAILVDGSVVSCGYADAGGDTSAVQAQLKNVQCIQALEQPLLLSLAMDPSRHGVGAADGGGDSGCLVAEWIHFTLFGIISPTIKLKVHILGGL